MINSFKITNINIDKLNKKIDEFQVSNQLSPYIFMNSDTIEELIKIAGYNPDKVWGVMEQEGIYGTYKGNKIFCDEEKRFWRSRIEINIVLLKA